MIVSAIAVLDMALRNHPTLSITMPDGVDRNMNGLICFPSVSMIASDAGDSTTLATSSLRTRHSVPDAQDPHHLLLQHDLLGAQLIEAPGKDRTDEAGAEPVAKRVPVAGRRQRRVLARVCQPGKHQSRG